MMIFQARPVGLVALPPEVGRPDRRAVYKRPPAHIGAAGGRSDRRGRIGKRGVSLNRKR